jgi:hypothetical protein
MSRRIPDDEVETIAALAERDRPFAIQLGAKRLRGIATRYMGLHPGWTTGGKYDSRTYDRANAILAIAQGLERTRRVNRRK